MKLIILDRDGVINEDSPDYVKSVAQWRPLPGSIQAIARLSRAGYQVVIATNQSGLGRGYFSRAELEAMHHKLTALVEEAGGQLAGIFHCPHTPEDGCDCRKPAPGLLDAIARHFRLDDLTGRPLVGDSLRDLEAGATRGCDLYLVRTGKGLASEGKIRAHEDPAVAGAAVFDNLAAVADALLDREEAP